MVDLKGLHYIAHLLARPGKEIPVLTLATPLKKRSASRFPDESPPSEDSRDGARNEEDSGRATGGDPVDGKIDREALESYKQAVADLDREIQEAEHFKDSATTARLQEEREQILAQLKADIAPGGKSGKWASSPEKARSAVTHAIDTAVARIGQADPTLQRHLNNALQKGSFCSYKPDRSIPWNL